MDVAVGFNENTKEKAAIDTLFSYLDKGIDDMEAGRMHTVDEAFRIIEDNAEFDI